MTKRLLSSLIIGLFALVIAACSSESRVDQFDPQLFATPEYKLVLCFDLRNDRDPVAGLVIRREAGNQTALHYVDLPFASSAVQESRALSVTTGKSLSNGTLITYTISPQNAEINGIGIKPLFGYPGTPDLRENTSSSLFFIRSPDDRRFFYKYSNPASAPAEKSTGPQAREMTRLDAIAIAFPEASEGVEISDGQTSIPPFLTQKEGGRIRYYPASAVQNAKRLYVRYRLSDTYSPVLIGFLMKLIGVLLVPIVGLILLKKKRSQTPTNTAHSYHSFGGWSSYL